MNNFVIATRVLLKNKFYSLLNIMGLAVGLTVAIIIFLYVQNDLSYDKQHGDYKNIYRIESNFVISGEDDSYALASQFLPFALQNEYPEVKNYVRFRGAGKVLFRLGDNQFYENDIYYADSSTFTVFDYEMIQGDPKTALDAPNSIVLTESLAKKHFGNEDAMGQVLKTPTNQFQVTGIMKDLPSNVHMRFDGLMSYETLETDKTLLERQKQQGGLWAPSDFSYLQFADGYDTKALLSKFPEFYDKYMAPFARLAGFDGSFSMNLTNIADTHFNSNPPQFDFATGNRNYIYAFSAIGIFILILASINYMNLASARSVSRSKEVGIRKVMGSTKGALVTQFLSESVIISFISLLLAYGFVALLINGVNMGNLLGKQLEFNLLANPILLTSSVLITLFIGIVSGLYPAFYLSSISTIRALKGAAKSGKGSLNMRRTLVSFQFFISIGIIISTLLMKDQIDFLNDKDLGFNKDNVVIVNMQDTTISNRVEFIKSELMQSPDVVSVSDAIMVGGDTNLGNNLLGASKSLIRAEGSDSVNVDKTYPVLFVGDDYVKTMQLELVAGRDFDKNQPSDRTTGVLVNEAMVKAMGWDEAIGKRVGLPFPGELPKVIGVVKDFNAFSLHNEVEPTVIFHYRFNPFLLAQGAFPSFLIHVNGNNLRSTMDFLETKFVDLDPSHPFEYRFLDTRAEELYREDQRQSELTGLLSYICIFISCLGLLGLASFTTSQRIKEIGVRKVLGASIPQLVFMIFKDVLTLILIGFAVSIPVSYYLIQNWLQEFAYQMPLAQTLAFATIISGLLAILVAFLTVSYHSLRAASQNPVKALRYE